MYDGHGMPRGGKPRSPGFFHCFPSWAAKQIDAFRDLGPRGRAQVLGNYTPADNAALNSGDLDLGSTSPVFIASGVLAKGGKDRLIRLVSVSTISGAAPHSGVEAQNVATPSKSMLFTALAVWQNPQQTWLFAADNGALTAVWTQATGGTSPVIAGGLLYVYNAGANQHSASGVLDIWSAPGRRNGVHKAAR